jgi:sugar O-acyltransferase (sialic acid O-acetyltransferase NeuD family)
MTAKKLVLIGTGELAHIAYEYFTHDSDYDVVGFSVNREYLKDPTFQGLPVVAFEEIEMHFSPETHTAFVAIPSSQLNKVRTRLYLEAKQKGYSFATYISSHAFVWRNAEIGENCFIFENNVIQHFVKIGNNCILWSGNHVGHRTVIEDNCFLTSHVVVSGYCTIGESSFLGVNSTFNDYTGTAPRCVVGSGSLVVKKLTEPDSLYVGSPAKIVPGRHTSELKL